MSMMLEVPDGVQQALRVPESERQVRLLVELACALYQREILSFGKAAELAQLSQSRFSMALAECSIPRHYSGADVADDLVYAGLL